MNIEETCQLCALPLPKHHKARLRRWMRGWVHQRCYYQAILRQKEEDQL